MYTYFYIAKLGSNIVNVRRFDIEMVYICIAQEIIITKMYITSLSFKPTKTAIC